MVHTWQLLDEMVRFLHIAILIVCYVCYFYLFLFLCKKVKQNLGFILTQCIQVTCECSIIQKNTLYAVGKVIMVVYYVVLGGEICLVLVNLLEIGMFRFVSHFLTLELVKQ